MEENQKIIQLKGLTNIQLLQQFSNMIINQPVQRVIFKIKFQQKFSDPKKKLQKNIRQKTHEVLNSTKMRLMQNQFLQKIKQDHQMKIICSSFEDQLARLYELNQYQTIIQQSVRKENEMAIKFENLQQLQAEEQKQKIKRQYNFITFIIGNSYFRLKNYDKAQEFYLKTKDGQQMTQRAQRMNNLGTCYAVKKLYQKALKSYNQAIKYYSKSPDQNTSNLLGNIAMIYMKSQMYKTAQQYFNNSILQRKQRCCSNKAMFYNSYLNLGICQKKLKKYDVSINNLLIALNYTQEESRKKMQVLNQMCRVYQQQQKWSEALVLYQKISQEYQIQGKSQGQIYQRVSKIQQKLGNTDLSTKFSKIALRIYSQKQNQRKIHQISCNLSPKIGLKR